MSQMCIYWVIHYFVEDINYNFHLRFGAKLKGCKNDFRKLAAYLFYFYKKISISQICWRF